MLLSSLRGEVIHLAVRFLPMGLILQAYVVVVVFVPQPQPQRPPLPGLEL
eukprot:FN608586.1.p1 GENE.FN608586.1~~FN608586.1.p1  ORF type:complete len:50 (-),score=5.70 FN608586.1:5-154(-)